MFVYRKAVVCGIADSLPAAALRQCESQEPIDLQKARLQKQQYVDALKVDKADLIGKRKIDPLHFVVFYAFCFLVFGGRGD